MDVWGGLTNSCDKKRSEKQRRKGKIKASECRVQRIARRDKKAFFSDQCKEIEENNRMGNTRDLFKKIRDTKGTFHAKMGSIEDRNSMDLTEAEDIKKRWQEYTAAAAKLLQSCPTLCKPIDGSSPGSLIPGILQARTLEWGALPSPKVVILPSFYVC